MVYASPVLPWVTGAHDTYDFLLTMKIPSIFHIAIFQLLSVKSLQIFAHAMTAELSCHVQNFVMITLSKFKFSLNMNVDGKTLVKWAPGQIGTIVHFLHWSCLSLEDSFTIFLHSPNTSYLLACQYGCARRPSVVSSKWWKFPPVTWTHNSLKLWLF